MVHQPHREKVYSKQGILNDDAQGRFWQLRVVGIAMLCSCG